MKPVESYIVLTSHDVRTAEKDGNYISYQGENIIFSGGDFSSDEVKNFLKNTYSFLGKIALETKDKKYYLLSDRYKPESVEPFSVYTDLSEKGEIGIEEMVSYIVE